MTPADDGDGDDDDLMMVMATVDGPGGGLACPVQCLCPPVRRLDDNVWCIVICDSVTFSSLKHTTARGVQTSHTLRISVLLGEGTPTRRVQVNPEFNGYWGCPVVGREFQVAGGVGAGWNCFRCCTG